MDHAGIINRIIGECTNHEELAERLHAAFPSTDSATLCEWVKTVQTAKDKNRVRAVVRAIMANKEALAPVLDWLADEVRKRLSTQ